MIERHHHHDQAAQQVDAVETRAGHHGARLVGPDRDSRSGRVMPVSVNSAMAVAVS